MNRRMSESSLERWRSTPALYEALCARSASSATSSGKFLDRRRRKAWSVARARRPRFARPRRRWPSPSRSPERARDGERHPIAFVFVRWHSTCDERAHSRFRFIVIRRHVITYASTIADRSRAREAPSRARGVPSSFEIRAQMSLFCSRPSKLHSHVCVNSIRDWDMVQHRRSTSSLWGNRDM